MSLKNSKKNFMSSFTKFILLMHLLILLKSFSQFGWYPLNSGTAQNLNSLYGNFYIAGDSGMILKGINYGADWVRVPSPTTTKQHHKVKRDG